MPDYAKPNANPAVLTEPTTNRDGVPVTDDSGNPVTAETQIFLLGRNPSNGRIDTFDPESIKPTDFGTYDYAAGSAATTVSVPSGARLKRVSVLPGPSGATVAIAGGDTITVVADSDFNETVPGICVAPAVVIGGDVEAYYVSWVV